MLFEVKRVICVRWPGTWVVGLGLLLFEVGPRAVGPELTGYVLASQTDGW